MAEVMLDKSLPLWPQLFSSIKWCSVPLCLVPQPWEGPGTMETYAKESSPGIE